MAVKIAFYGAVHEIGGSKTHLQYNGTNLFFDFGKDFLAGTEAFSERLQPAGYLPIRDYLGFGALPPVAGLYPPQQVTFLEKEFGRHLLAERVDGILLSHAHIDHFGFLPLVDVGVPLYMSAGTLEALQYFQESSAFDLRLEQRPVTILEPGRIVHIGACEVLPLRTDHDVLGSLGFIVRCGGTSVVYTGDYRLHGRHPEWTSAFFDQVRREGQHARVVLLTEGTRLGFGSIDQLNEDQIQELATRTVAAAQGLVLTNYYALDTERLKIFLRVAEQTGRVLVVQPQHLLLARRFARFDSDLEHLLQGAQVYLARRGSGRYLASDYRPFEQEYLMNSLRAADIAADPSRYMLQLDFPDLVELQEIAPAPHTTFIQSGGEPLGQYDPNYAILIKWMKHFGMDFYRIATPGHASELDIRAMVQHAAPQVLIPMHTKNPEALDGYGREETVIPRKGVTYEF